MSQEIPYLCLKSHPLFAAVPEERLLKAASLAKVRTVRRGESFGYSNSAYSKIYLLIKGKIKIAVNDDGDHELIKAVLTAPDVFGDLGLEGNSVPDEYAQALTGNTTVCWLLTTDFRRLLQEDPMMAIRYAHIVNAKLQLLEGRHSDLVFRDAKSRLVRFIRNWAYADGSRVGDKIVLNNYLTHSEIAGLIATSRQSVNVLLNELRDSGLLFYNRKTIELNGLVAWTQH